jgi:hypothetical protein
MTDQQVAERDHVVEQDRPTPGRRPRLLLGIVAVVVAVVVGFGAGWLVFGDDDQSDTSTSAPDGVPEGVMDVVDEFMTAFESNDYVLLQDVVTPGFRRPFYIGDPNGAPQRNVYAIEFYEFMDDPNVSDTEVVFFDIETVGDPIVRGDGPWYVSEAQNWREADRPNQYEAVHTVVVVEDDGEFLVDDAYFAGTTVLVTDE